MAVVFQRIRVCGKFVILARVLGIPEEAIERIDQTDAKDQNKMADVLHNYTQKYGEPEDGLDFMLLLEFLCAHKEYACLSNSCDKIRNIQDSFMKEIENDNTAIEITTPQTDLEMANNDHTIIDSGIGNSLGLVPIIHGDPDALDDDALLNQNENTVSSTSSRGEPPIPFMDYLLRDNHQEDFEIV